MTEFDDNFWNGRYKTKEIPWDIGYAAPPIATYFDQLRNKDIRILIPGCGNAYEAKYLLELGFTNVFLIDISTAAIENIKKNLPDLAEDRIFCGDFFEHSGQYDLIVEQTFFCAITPQLRPNYVKKMNDLLSPNGKLIGLLFDAPLNTDHPPFGGRKQEYKTLFENHFKLNTFETAHNSIAPRAKRELFINFSKI